VEFARLQRISSVSSFTIEMILFRAFYVILELCDEPRLQKAHIIGENVRQCLLYPPFQGAKP
jgi:hypothetical protein